MRNHLQKEAFLKWLEQEQKTHPPLIDFLKNQDAKWWLSIAYAAGIEKLNSRILEATRLVTTMGGDSDLD